MEILNHWFYTHKTWQVGAAIDITIVAIALLGLFVFHRLINWHNREHDTPMVGLSYALAGGVYAVMLAFVAANTFETMSRADEIASEEANCLSGMVFDAGGLAPDTGIPVRNDVIRYIDVVTKKEWPAQRAYKMEDSNFEEGWALLRKISVELAAYEPKTEGQSTVKLEIEHEINDLFTARRMRVLAATQHLPEAIWMMLILGLGMVALYLYLFGPHSFKMHMAVTTLTMLSIGFVFTLVVAEDYPFRGIVSVSSEAYSGVKEVAEHVLNHTAEKPGEHATDEDTER